MARTRRGSNHVQPCTNLLVDFSCGIRPGLREQGFPGCAVFDCFGAGQQVTQVTPEGPLRAELDGAIFLTQPQLAAAQGDATTTIPASLARPAHWAWPSRRRTRQ
ncbi:hypothetical protein [Phytoactinopolyspora mesophila]|uniref:Uncharacterized protein n=1 Tax=Phytoactinopolyspora mesophila TaxID=2650750 RepID=A0A7K3LYZ7_9ACTN|nr:hypothetical protein [Phytoactinopolyspora mesophila]NDL55912.1 hypothetical protein [Phytoactinopolyspora mesophila]